ncbi:hypothetical protein TB2_036306 [Malus domestica]
MTGVPIRNSQLHKNIQISEGFIQEELDKMEGSVATASAGRAMMNGGDLSRRFSGRPSPKRGQVKMGIVVGLANSVASIFNPHGSSLHRQASK